MKKFIVRVNGKTYEVEVEEVTAGGTSAAAPAPAGTSAPPDPAPSSSDHGPKPAPISGAPSGERGRITAPMPGVILNVNVNPGDMVASGDVLMNLEAMKMENEIFAPFDGKVVSIHVAVRDSVNAGDPLIDLE